ncbi:MAG: response regulator transcription factor [Syntrophobacteraceae bacterium]|nr:response regulator transcription factor [Syntrophobacteraceae bacterium]
MEPRRVLIADDQTIMREGLKMLLSSDPSFEVVGEAQNGIEAVNSVKSQKPDLVLMDLSMPIMDGVSATRRIKKLSPRTKILVLTVHRGEEHILSALKSGADGYLLKDATYKELALAVENIFSGKGYLSRSVAQKPSAGNGEGAERIESHTSWGTLTRREREILTMIAEGGKSKEIACRLAISSKTVEKHRTNLMNKLNVHNISSLTALAVEMGLVSV